MIAIVNPDEVGFIQGRITFVATGAYKKAYQEAGVFLHRTIDLWI